MSVMTLMWCHWAGMSYMISSLRNYMIWIDFMLLFRSDNPESILFAMKKFNLSRSFDIWGWFLTSYRNGEMSALWGLVLDSGLSWQLLFLSLDFMNNAFNILRYIIQLLYRVTYNRLQCQKQEQANCQHYKQPIVLHDYYWWNTTYLRDWKIYPERSQT